MTALEALRLPGAQLTDKDNQQAADVIAEIQVHIRKTMTFAGAESLDVPYRDLSSMGAAKLVCLTLARDKWQVASQLLSLPPTLPGGKPQPHHWTFHIQPMAEVYVEFDAPVPTSLRLQ